MMKAVESNINETLNDGMKKISDNVPDFAKDLSQDDINSFYEADKPFERGLEGDDIVDTIETNREKLEINFDEYKEDFISRFNEANEIVELAADDLSNIADKTFDYIKEYSTDLGNKLGELIPEFDYQAIFENAGVAAAAGAAVGAGVGGVAGAITGALTGAISGAAGEMVGQIAKHNGASDTAVTAVKLATEVVIASGLGKLVFNGVSKAVSHLDDVGGMAKSSVDDVLAKSSNLIDNSKVFVGDKVKTVGYEAKGLVNDFKVHPFVDAKGNPLSPPMKISDMLDTSKGIKMDYNRFTPGNSNSAGFERNAAEYWKKYKDLYPEDLSKNNLALINKQPNPHSPIVDKKWLEHHPNQKAFLGEKLEHHHLNNTDMAVAAPQTLHRGKLNKDMLHVD